MASESGGWRSLLGTVDFSGGLDRDQLKHRVPELPDDLYIYLPSAKKFYSVDDVMEQTGEHALARAEGSSGGPEEDRLENEAAEDEGPVAFGDSLSPGDHFTEGAGDYPGAEDDIGGSSIETRAGRGTHEAGE